jgi:hypothetical protein
MIKTAKRKFVYTPRDEAVIKLAKEAEHLDRWRVEKGLDNPKLGREGEISRYGSAGVRRVRRRFFE